MKKSIILSAIIGAIIGTVVCFFVIQKTILEKAILAVPGATNTTSTETVYATQIKWGIPIIYTNEQYGFKFVLPESWTGYSVLKTTWDVTDDHGNVTTSGPVIIFRNPTWTKDAPYQDIPIEIFTFDQWDGLGTKYGYPWAGGIPIELGRNSKYIFILTPRYNFADGVLGIQEVVKIMESEPLHAF